MARVTGIGGVFFRAHDPAALAQWYKEHLGMDITDDGYVTFDWSAGQTIESPGSSVWALFPEDTTYFGSGNQTFMINYRVDDLDGLRSSLKTAGVTVDDRVEDLSYGRFGWCTDPEGNVIELWEPAAEA